MRDGFKVIDADAHMQEPPDLWDNYVEPEFHHRRPIVKEVRHRILFQYETSELFPDDSEGLPSSVWKRRPQELYNGLAQKYGQAYDNWWSAKSRLVDMERYGWDKMVCIPGHGSAPLRQSGKDPRPHVGPRQSLSQLGPRLLQRRPVSSQDGRRTPTLRPGAGRCRDPARRHPIGRNHRYDAQTPGRQVLAPPGV